jgi:hypothetical protein
MHCSGSVTYSMGTDPWFRTHTVCYGSGFCYFVSDSQDANKKKVFFPYLFRILLSVDTYISIFLVYGSKAPDPDPLLFSSVDLKMSTKK